MVNLEDGNDSPTAEKVYLEVQRALEMGMTWIAGEDGDYICTWLGDYDDYVGGFVRRVDIVQMDTCLPAVIEHFCKTRPMQENGFYIQQTMKFWENPGPALPENTETPGRQMYLLEIKKINVHHSTPGCTYLEVAAHDTATLADGSEVYATGYFKNIRVSTDWLEQHYPGAVNRIAAGQLFGYTAEALLDYVFPLDEERPMKTIALPNAIGENDLF